MFLSMRFWAFKASDWCLMEMSFERNKLAADNATNSEHKFASILNESVRMLYSIKQQCYKVRIRLINLHGC